MGKAIVIVGAGVIGLDVALLLAERGYGPHITIVAEHLPGDTSINYTSPWAGANFSAISGNDKNALRWDQLGYGYMMKLAEERGVEACISKTPSFEYWDKTPSREKIDSMATYLKDFKILSQSDIPSGCEFGISCTTVTVNAPRYIQYLHRLLQEKYGVQFVREKLDNIKSAFGPSTKIVFNCTGNGARVLAGVQDSRCFPTRGQILLTRAPHINKNVMRHGADYETYIIPRPQSNGNIILGGYMQKGVDTGDTFSSESESIVERTTTLLPELVSGGMEVLAAFSGLRPSREGGARVERTSIEIDGKKKGVLVHNYGAGGTGFQAGLGMAHEAIGTVEDILSQLPAKDSKL